MDTERVLVTISFNVETVQWSREFHISRGSTIRQLKELMVQPKGGKRDVDSFELQRGGHRLHDKSSILGDHALDFAFLGPDEGGKRARKDAGSQPSGEGLLDLPEAQVKEQLEDSSTHSTAPAAATGSEQHTVDADSAGSVVLPTPASHQEGQDVLVESRGLPVPPQESDVTKEPPKTLMGYTVGDRAEAQYKSGRWYPVTIRDVNDDGTFSIRWDDSDEEDLVKPASRLRRLRRIEGKRASEAREDKGGAQAARVEGEDLAAGRAMPGGHGTKNAKEEAERAAEEVTQAAPAEAAQEPLSKNAVERQEEGRKAEKAKQQDVPPTLGGDMGTKVVEAEAADTAQATQDAPPPVMDEVPAEPAPEPKRGVTVIVTIDTDLDLHMTLSMPPGATILDVRKKIVSSGHAQGARLSNFGLCLPHVSRLHLSGPIPDSHVLTERIKHLIFTEPLKEKPGEFLTLEQGLELQEEMIKRMAAAEFQRKVADLQARHPDHNKLSYRKELNVLVLTVQAQVLPKYGFPGTSEGVAKMMKAYSPWSTHEEVMRNNEIIRKLL